MKPNIIVEERVSSNENHWKWLVYKKSMFGYQRIYATNSEEDLKNVVANCGEEYRKWTEKELQEFMKGGHE